VVVVKDGKVLSDQRQAPKRVDLQALPAPAAAH
jgi:hypothetical protein